MFRFLVSLHFPQILILSGPRHLFWRARLPYTPHFHAPSICVRSVSVDLRFLVNIHIVWFVHILAKKVTTVYYLHLATIPHTNIHLTTICYFLFEYGWPVFPANIFIRQGAIAEDLWPPRSLWNLPERDVALHRPTYLDFRFALNFGFDYLYVSCYLNRFFSWKVLWGLRGLKIHFLWIISWSPTTLTTHILGPYMC